MMSGPPFSHKTVSPSSAVRLGLGIGVADDPLRSAVSNLNVPSNHPYHPLVVAAASAVSERLWRDDPEGRRISPSPTLIACAMARDEGGPNESFATGTELPSHVEGPSKGR